MYPQQIILANSFFFFNDTATTEIYTLSLHDALPIFKSDNAGSNATFSGTFTDLTGFEDRKSTRLNSSHLVISYAVFCLKKNNDQSLRDSLPSPNLSAPCSPLQTLSP